MPSPNANLALLEAVHKAPAGAEPPHIAKACGMRSDNARRAIARARERGQIEPDSLTLTPSGARLAGVTVTPAVGDDTPHQPVPTADVSSPAIVSATAAQTLPLDMIDRNPLNYRKTFNQEKLAELADGIKAKGLLQPISVRPYGDLTERYQIVIGERRWRAMQLLVKAGDWPADHPVPAIIRDGSDIDILEIMVMENAQREDVHPIEEASAIAKLQDLRAEQAGESARDVCVDIAAQLGKSTRWAQRRVKMVRGLSAACTAAYAEGKFNSFETAELLARYPHDAQDDALQALTRKHHPLQFVHQVKDHLEEDAPIVGDAMFGLEHYEAAGGTYIEPTDDELQRRFANKAIAQQLTIDWIEAEIAAITDQQGYTSQPIRETYYSDYSYPKATKKIPAEFHCIHVAQRRDSLEVIIHHPVYDRDAYERHLAKTAKAAKTEDGATIKPISKTIWELGSIARTKVLRTSIAADPRVAMALTLLSTFPDSEGADRSIVRIKPDGSENTHSRRFQEVCKPPLKNLKEMPRYHWEKTGDKILKCTHRGKALTELLARDDVAELFAARVADLTCDSRFDDRPGAMQESVALSAAGLVADPDHAPADRFWIEKYNKAQLTAAIDAYKLHADISGMKKGEADKAVHKAWPDGLTPIEARFLDPKQAEAAQAKLLQGKPV